MCREQDQEIRLRRNWVAEELVAHFSQSRESLLDFARKAGRSLQEDEPQGLPPRKRRKVDQTHSSQVEPRSTRSQSRRVLQSSQESTQVLSVADSEDGSEYEDEQPTNGAAEHAVDPNDGLVPCPVCGKRMKEEAVYPHLDTCSGEAPSSLQYPHTKPITTGLIAYALPHHTSVKERLPTINWAILNENQQRKKLRELGILSTGSKLLMQSRHKEWLNLWNANCDSRNPRPKRDLLRDLDTWERTQGRQIATNAGPNGVMVKDFDRHGYVKSHKGDFDDLIQRAKAKAKANRDQVDGPAETEKQHDPGDSRDTAHIAKQRESEESPVLRPTVEECFRPPQMNGTELPPSSQSNG